jgi:hypothetical protein
MARAATPRIRAAGSGDVASAPGSVGPAQRGWSIDHDLRPSVALRSGEGANVGETAGVSDEVAPRSGGSSLHKRRNGDRHGAGPTRRNGA